jgi:hypothetical protein
MSLSPKITILCSATLPDAEEINPIILDFKNRHPSANPVISVCSKESLIGCEIINFDGSTILPHNDCKTVKELTIIIENLKEVIKNTTNENEIDYMNEALECCASAVWNLKHAKECLEARIKFVEENI